MQFFYKNRGNVSIFLTIILVPIIAVCTLFIDVSRVYLAKEMTSSSADLALNTVLSQYDTDLEQYYGLMGSCQNIEELYDVSEEYFKACMKSQGVAETDAQKWAKQLREILGGNTTFDDLIKIDDGNTDAEIKNIDNANLSNSVMMREQVTEFMKYRGPVDIVKNLEHNKGKYSDALSNIEGVAEHAKNLPYETAIQKAKTDYYDAENALLQKSLETFEKLEEYEKLKLCEQYMSDTKDCYDKLYDEFQTLHGRYLTTWANMDKIWELNFQSPDSLVGTPSKTIDAPEDGFTVGDINGYGSTLATKITEYRSARDAAELPCTENPEIAAVADGDTVPAQYWMQMEGKLSKDVYTNYINSYIDMLVSLENLSFAMANQNEDEETDEVISDDTKEAKKNAESEKNHFKNYEIYTTATRMASYCSSTNEDTTEEAATKEILAALKYGSNTHGTSDKFVERYENIIDGMHFMVGDNKDTDDDLTNTGSLKGFYKDFMDLADLVDEYDKAFQIWKEKLGNAQGAGIDSPIVDQSEEDIGTIEGTTDESKGLVRLDVKRADCEFMANYCQRIGILFQSYLKCAEELKYEETPIMSKNLTSKCNKTGGIYNLATFKTAIHEGSDLALSVIGEDEYEIPVSKSMNSALADDTYYFHKEAINDLIAFVASGDTVNNPCFHTSVDSPTSENSNYPMERFLHEKFDGHEATSEQTKNWLKNLKKMMKNISKKFTGYDRSKHVSTNEIAGQPDLPSSLDGSASETSDMMGVDESEDSVTEDMGGVDVVAGIFSKVADLLVNGRDDVYSTDYVMNMFSYETHYMEKMYNAAREGASTDNIYAINRAPNTIDPSNADKLYDAAEVGSAEDFLNNTDLKKTYNKSMTNKVIYMMPAGADKEKTVKGNNWAYGHEVEYILTGKSNSESTMQLQTTLYFIRYAFDLAPVFQKYWTDGIVESISAAVCEASCGVIPIPAVKLIICLGICAAEAAVDRNYLMAGLPVPLIKVVTKEDDELFISFSATEDAFKEKMKNAGDADDFFDLSGQAIKETGGFPRFQYSDYLTIFLFLEFCITKDAVYKRMSDVIQVNMANNPKLEESYKETGFKMQSALTHYEIDTTVRVKPLMVALPYAREYGTGTLLETFDWNTFEYKTAEGY